MFQNYLDCIWYLCRIRHPNLLLGQHRLLMQLRHHFRDSWLMIRILGLPGNSKTLLNGLMSHQWRMRLLVTCHQWEIAWHRRVESLLLLQWMRCSRMWMSRCWHQSRTRHSRSRGKAAVERWHAAGSHWNVHTTLLLHATHLMDQLVGRKCGLGMTMLMLYWLGSLGRLSKLLWV